MNNIGVNKVSDGLILNPPLTDCLLAYFTSSLRESIPCASVTRTM